MRSNIKIAIIFDHTNNTNAIQAIIMIRDAPGIREISGIQYLFDFFLLSSRIAGYR